MGGQPPGGCRVAGIPAHTQLVDPALFGQQFREPVIGALVPGIGPGAKNGDGLPGNPDYAERTAC